MNPGGVRADLDAGPVTYEEAFTVQPFANNLVTLDLTGAQLDCVLEQQFVTERTAAAVGARWATPCDPDGAPGTAADPCAGHEGGATSSSAVSRSTPPPPTGSR